VLHVRNYSFATLCELCEQSMHAFVSFGTVACSTPALKVGCLPAGWAVHRVQEGVVASWEHEDSGAGVVRRSTTVPRAC